MPLLVQTELSQFEMGDKSLSTQALTRVSHTRKIGQIWSQMKTIIFFNYRWADADPSGNIGTSTKQFYTEVSVPALPRPGDSISFFPDLDEVRKARVWFGKVKEVTWKPRVSKESGAVLEPLIVLEDIEDNSVRCKENSHIRAILIEEGRGELGFGGLYQIIEDEIVAQGDAGGLQFYRCTAQT